MYVERDFHIVSSMPQGRYVSHIGHKMVIKKQNGSRYQIWYFHQRSRTIRSRENNRSWDITGGGKSYGMQVWNTNSQWYQIFKYDGTYFTNFHTHNRVMDVQGGKDLEAQLIEVHKKKGTAAQKWKIIYIDEIKQPYQEKGAFNKYFGFIVNEPFYLRSRLPMGRVMEGYGARNVLLRAYKKGNIG
jgi:hypothetical protein